ncbi:hypothetical protein R1flu_010225 [Riccia fluitans]|uniref:Uncharacterized protein n=1 Tax=Riccia fluitans TaxID=41844 RepID=A0ABD1Z4H0_9MARC
MRSLSGVKPPRCASANATPRSHAGSQKQTPRTPVLRARSSGAIGTGELGGVDELLHRAGGKPLPPPWNPHGELPLSRSHLLSPRMKPVSRLSMAARDKESLLAEIIQLKKTMIQQGELLKTKNARNSAIEHRNRMLEMDVFYLETALNADGPRTGSPHRLRAKLQSLQTAVEQLQDTCDAQREELIQLRRDLRVTRMREVEVERDVFSDEVKRLQKVVKRLQTMHKKIRCENRDLGRFKTKCQKLEMVNQRLESCMTARSIKPQAQPKSGIHRQNMQNIVSSHRNSVQFRTKQWRFTKVLHRRLKDLKTT